MHLSDFDYALPPDRIALKPVEPRDASRMMVLHATGAITDCAFRDLPSKLRSTDVLVLNDTRVLRARTRARLERRNGTSRDMEVFFAEPVRENLWHVLCKPGRRIRPGDRAVFGPDLAGTFRDSMGADLHVLEVESAREVLERYGELPLPPYIDRPVTDADEEHYQTVFGVNAGAVAAPTAGLHFTENILHAVRAQGVEVVHVTLHVGIGTFLPVRVERPEEHVLRPERFAVSEEAAAALERARDEGRRIVAVGTTTTRTLEYLMHRHGGIRAGTGSADLFILPGFEFRCVGALLTNFHLPRSTLLMLVSAFAGRERILDAYRRAIAGGYRFYSYGDCMLIERS